MTIAVPVAVWRGTSPALHSGFGSEPDSLITYMALSLRSLSPHDMDSHTLFHCQCATR